LPARRDDLLLYILLKCEQEQPKDKRDTTKRMMTYRLLKAEFVLGCQRMGCCTVEALRAKLPALRKEVEEEERFKAFWAFLHRYFCELHPSAGLQNNPTKATSIAVAKMVLGKRPARFPLLDLFLDFLENTPSVAVVTRDNWQMMLHFGRTVKPDFSNFDTCGDAWTTLFDEFKAFAEARAGGAGGAGGAGDEGGAGAGAASRGGGAGSS